MNNKTLVSYNFSKFECDGDVFDQMILTCKGDNAKEISRYISAVMEDEKDGNFVLIPTLDSEDNFVTSRGLLHWNVTKNEIIELLNITLYYARIEYNNSIELV